MQWYNGPARSTEIMLAEFRSSNFFEGFALVSDDEVTEAIELAKTIFSACERATLFLAAHLLAQLMALNNSTALDLSGGATYENAAVGELRATYKPNVDKPTDVDFTTTPYGQKFIQLRNVCPRYRFALGVAG